MRSIPHFSRFLHFCAHAFYQERVDVVTSRPKYLTSLRFVPVTYFFQETQGHENAWNGFQKGVENAGNP